MTELPTETAYYADLHFTGFRPGERGEIIGVVLLSGRPVYVVRYGDGVIDYKNIYDEAPENYRIDNGAL